VSLTREKAAVALELKRQGRESIFSCPLDVKCNWAPPVYDDKTPEDEGFLKLAMIDHIFFEGLSNIELETLVHATERVQLQKGEKAVRQNARGEYLYIVQKGKFDLYCEMGQHSNGTIGKGEMFGQLALLYGKDFDVSVIAKENAVVWRLEQDTFRNVVARHAREKDADIIGHLSKVDLFQGLSAPVLQKIAESLTTVHFQEGDVIVRRGDAGEIFYIIESGSVKVYDIGMGDSVSSEHILKDGDYFGERALLMDEPRAASVAALTDVTTLAMDRVTFEKSIGDLQDLMDQQARKHSLKSLPILAGADLKDIECDRLAEHMHEICFPKGTKLAFIGQPYPKKVWFIRKGQLIVYGNKSGKIYNLRTGDYFGEKSILSDPGHISSHEAVCEENVTAWVLSRDDMESVIVDLGRLGKVGDYVKSTYQKASIRGLQDIKKLRVLGQGGFGKVWLVESKRSGTSLALKVINKRRLIDSKQERSVLREKDLLGLLHHPFILNMVAAFQDPVNLYLVLPLVQGGELFNVVASKTKGGRGLPNNDAAFYAAGIIEALGHFHHRYIAYRDMKLENVMIDGEGYPKIVDLGFARVIVDKSYTFCGTPDYLAPEIIMSKGHNHAVDYWSYGVLVYEMLVGHAPFRKSAQSQMDMFKNIVLVKYEFPLLMSTTGQDLIKKLLVRQVPSRLGAQSRGHYDIAEHPWFKESDIDRKKLVKGKIAPPWVPEVKDPFDASNFDDFSSLEMEREDLGTPLSNEEQAIFADF
jgi:CRP-like cAMP-binding protein